MLIGFGGEILFVLECPVEAICNYTVLGDTACSLQHGDKNDMRRLCFVLSICLNG